MNLISNWPDILKRAWSVRLMILAAILTGIEAALPIIEPYVSIPHSLFAVLSGVVVALALFARLIAQRNLPESEP